mgnify:CR=1 FL=1
MLKWLTEEERERLKKQYGLNPSANNNPILDEYMKRKREKRPLLASDKVYELYYSLDLVQLWFQTPSCRFSQMGKCTMCNYWNGRRIPRLMEIMLPELSLPKDCQTILINTCGSCLDPIEVPIEDLIRLLKWLKHCPAKKVIFETHWTTLTSKTLELISSSLPHKKIMYEIGIESANSDTLFYLLNKPSSVIDIKKIINKIHQYNAEAIMNVIFGVPFLNPEEQIEDAVTSVKYLLENHVDYIVLFPVNIKPQTIFMDLHQRGEYQTVPIRIISDILLGNFSDALEKINIAWFGDRSEEGVIPPKSCKNCRDRAIYLFQQYNLSETNLERKKILQQIHDIKCDCITTYLSEKKSGGVYDRIRQYYNLIKIMRDEQNEKNRSTSSYKYKLQFMLPSLL